MARQRLVRLAFRHAQEIVEEFRFRVRAGEDRGRGVMGATHVARVPGIAAAIEFGRRLEDEDARPRTARADRGAERGIAAADDQHIIRRALVEQLFPDGAFRPAPAFHGGGTSINTAMRPAPRP